MGLVRGYVSPRAWLPKSPVPGRPYPRGPVDLPLPAARRRGGPTQHKTIKMPGDLVPGTEKGSPALAQRVFPESLTPLRRPLSGRAGSLRLWRGRTPHPSSPSYSPPGQAGGLPAASGDSRRAREPVRGGWGWLTAPRQPRRLERWEQAGGCAGGRSFSSSCPRPSAGRTSVRDPCLKGTLGNRVCPDSGPAGSPGS